MRGARRVRLLIAALSCGSPLLLSGSASVVGDRPPAYAATAHAPTPSPRPSAATGLQVIAAPPERIVISAVDLDSPVGVDRTAPGAVVDPPRVDRPYWLSAYGTPGTDATNTVYVAGHSSDTNRAIFDRLLGPWREPIDLTGKSIELHTRSGVLTYVVSGPAELLAKSQIADDPKVWARQPGRLVLVTCHRNDRRLNIVFAAELVAAAGR